MLHIAHDTHHKIDYVLIRDSDDPLSTVSYTQSAGATITVDSCSINVAPITDSLGNVYPAGSAIIVWIEGGTVGSIEWVRVEYTTVGGRRLDEKLVFTVVEED